ncbi:MAG: membrane dipeptidase [Acidimicrobiales bacterium]
MIIDGLEINDWSRPIIEEVRSGGIDIVHATVGVWEDTANTFTRIGAMRHLVRHNSDIVRIVTNVAEMDQAKADGVLGLLFGFQNSSMVGDDPELVGMFSDVGVKVIQLTYNIANHLGSSCWEPHDGGLTRAGQRIVQACEDFGVLVDISHVGNKTGIDAARASDNPIAITHGNPIWFHDSPRNKPQEVIDAVAEKGGVIGVTLYPLFIGGAEVTRTQYCQMMADLAEKIGVDHVAIGSDAVLGWGPQALGWMRSGRWDRPTDPTEIPAFPPWPSWFGGPADFGNFDDGLAEVGFNSDDRAKILGGNWYRLFETVIG